MQRIIYHEIMATEENEFDFFSKFIPLEKDGPYYVGVCPNCGEKKFTIIHEKGFDCFHCEKKGEMQDFRNWLLSIFNMKENGEISNRICLSSERKKQDLSKERIEQHMKLKGIIS